MSCLFIASAPVLLGSCLIPQGIEFEPDGGPTGNRPPRIVADSTSPATPVTRIGADCRPEGDPAPQPLHFTVGAIIEEDVDDILEARWFIDYSLEAASRRTRNVDINIVPPDKDRLPVRAGPEFRAHAFDIGAPGTHLVEVVVSERDSFDDANAALPERAMKPGREASVFRWAVEIIAGSACCPGECP